LKIENHIIINLDIVGFSIKSEKEQVKLFTLLQKEVYFHFYDYFHNENPTAVMIPIGDGMIISINDNLDDCHSDNLISDVLKMIISLNEWEKNHNTKFKYAIHSGVITGILDINKNPNIVGHAINNSARLINGALDGELIVSKEFIDRYFNAAPKEGESYNIINNQTKIEYKIILNEEGIIIDKHGKGHQAYATSIYEAEKEIIRSEYIKTKYDEKVYHNKYPKDENLKEEFLKYLKISNKAIFYGVYFPKGKDILKSILESKSLKEIIFYVASADLEDELNINYNTFEKNDNSLESKTINQFINDVKEIKKGDLKEIDIKIYEYRKLPTFGFSMLDPDTFEKGYIHISHYFPNVLPKDNPYMNLKLNTTEPNSIYKLYKEKIEEFLENGDFKEIY